MSEIAAKYNPAESEDKWYKMWMDKGYFHSEPDNRTPYTIVIPPPNVTGVLHMGHMLNNTLQDVLIRRARMLGLNACWVPGTDHASIATEARVVAKLKADGIDKNTLTRDEFLKHAWIWKEKHGGIILEQLKKLGASCDWERTKFTMDESLSTSVIKVFVDLYGKGKIYRGIRMVNWDPAAKTAVSDEEVNYREEQSKLYYVRYIIEGTQDYIVVATTRPETILGDTAVCVHPEDERYAHLKGKNVIVPMVDRIVPIIFDEYVDREFGTGALKVTPAHDINDYELGIKHHLKSIDIFNDDGTLNESAEIFVGTDRFAARKLSVAKLEELGMLHKTEDYINKVGRSERTDAVIEPRLSQQWFMKMKEMADPALENVMNDNIQLIPAKFKNTYRHWMENVKDWCISRQLWWGHRIPAWYTKEGHEYFVAENADEALLAARKKYPELTLNDLKQDEDVLDTWFSSWLWPISVFDGINEPENKDMKYYYPTNDLITAPEILFFWVARMIMAGYEYTGKKPFNNVYLTGIVRDKLGRKMSKSLGNSPDPIELMQKYGADGVRVGMLLCSPAGNDLPFDESMPEQGRNFGNKIWNAYRLINMWNCDTTIAQPEYALKGCEWFDNKLSQAITEINDHFEKYRISDALMCVYKLFWDEFSAWYLEIVKPPFGSPIDSKTLETVKAHLATMLKLLHPFMPFITEEIWQNAGYSNESESIMMARWPEAKTISVPMINDFDELKEIITGIRSARTQYQIPMKESIDVIVLKGGSDVLTNWQALASKLAGITSIQVSDVKPDGAGAMMIKTTSYFIPLGEKLNAEEQILKLQKELEYNQGFLNSVLKKLSNENFVNNAPAQVLENENKKKADAETKINQLTEQIQQLKS
ncbi:MAG: valine--tRNA ligase [Bacteroidetes bacterium HGW-Bacteroidetes-21]|nr:MAG: valine--tRNA ligase [Bacteroidetes bacterium HGW-Bacteroidetes-21]